MKDFRDLKVWEKSHKLVLMVYSITGRFPKEELYGLVSQMRRSSASVPTNIAEGCGRNSDPQFRKFLNIAFASAVELEYQLILSRDLFFITEDEFDELISILVEIKRMLSSLQKAVG